MDDVQYKSPADRFFGNPLLVKCILEKTSWDPMRHLKFRLLNKTFNSEMLRRIRLAHRIIRIETPDAHRNRFEFHGPNQLIEHVDVNFHRLHILKLGDYFKFLNQVARVKLDELELVNCWALETYELKNELHIAVYDQLIKDQFPRALVGMDDLCRGCATCIKLAKQLVEYGPAQADFVRNILHDDPFPIHYSKLCVNEQDIVKIAWDSGHEALFRDDCLEKMMNQIPYFLSCDQLTITVGESRQYLPGKIVESMKQPREVLEELCRAWRVKRLRFEFDYFQRAGTSAPSWILHGYFTEFMFDRPIPEADRRVELEEVEIDLSRTNRAFEKAIDGSVGEYLHFSHLIPNIRKVFGTSHVIVKGDYEKRRFDEKTLENILKACWINKHDQGLEVSISMVICTDNSDYEMGDSFELLDRYFECSVVAGRLEEVTKTFDGDELVIQKYWGREFRIVDTCSKCILNLKLFVDSDDMREMSSENKKGLLKFFNL